MEGASLAACCAWCARMLLTMHHVEIATSLCPTTTLPTTAYLIVKFADSITNEYAGALLQQAAAALTCNQLPANDSCTADPSCALDATQVRLRCARMGDCVHATRYAL
jgi:hypothetical protein